MDELERTKFLLDLERLNPGILRKHFLASNDFSALGEDIQGEKDSDVNPSFASVISVIALIVAVIALGLILKHI